MQQLPLLLDVGIVLVVVAIGILIIHLQQRYLRDTRQMPDASTDISLDPNNVAINNLHIEPNHTNGQTGIAEGSPQTTTSNGSHDETSSFSLNHEARTKFISSEDDQTTNDVKHSQSSIVGNDRPIQALQKEVSQKKVGAKPIEESRQSSRPTNDAKLNRQDDTTSTKERRRSSGFANNVKLNERSNDNHVQHEEPLKPSQEDFLHANFDLNEVCRQQTGTPEGFKMCENEPVAQSQVGEEISQGQVDANPIKERRRSSSLANDKKMNESCNEYHIQHDKSFNASPEDSLVNSELNELCKQETGTTRGSKTCDSQPAPRSQSRVHINSKRVLEVNGSTRPRILEDLTCKVVQSVQLLHEEKSKFSFNPKPVNDGDEIIFDQQVTHGSKYCDVCNHPSIQPSENNSLQGVTKSDQSMQMYQNFRFRKEQLFDRDCRTNNWTGHDLCTQPPQKNQEDFRPLVNRYKRETWNGPIETIKTQYCFPFQRSGWREAKLKAGLTHCRNMLGKWDQNMKKRNPPSHQGMKFTRRFRKCHENIDAHSAVRRTSLQDEFRWNKARINEGNTKGKARNLQKSFQRLSEHDVRNETSKPVQYHFTGALRRRRISKSVGIIFEYELCLEDVKP